jgi:hypothetical protein
MSDMRICLLGSTILGLVLGIISGCTTSWKPEAAKPGGNLFSFARTKSPTTAELEQRADQLVRIQEFKEAEELYSEILERDPKNEIVQQKLTDLQWKKRGASVPTSRRSGAAVAQVNRQPDRQTTSNVRQTLPPRNAAESASLRNSRDQGEFQKFDELIAANARPRVDASFIKPVERSTQADSQPAQRRIPEWAIDGPAQQRPIARNEHFAPTQTAPRQIAPRGVEQPAPAAERPSIPREEWTIAITPKSKSQQQVHFAPPQSPAVVNMKHRGPQAPTRESDFQAPSVFEEPRSVAAAEDFPHRSPTAAPPKSDSPGRAAASDPFVNRSRNDVDPVPPTAPPRDLRNVSDRDLQELVLAQPGNTAAIQEVFARLGSRRQEARWQAANTIEVLAYRPDTEPTILAGFARVLSESDPVLSTQALHVLQGMPEQSKQLQMLIRSKLDDQDHEVRSAAASVLTLIDSAEGPSKR